MTRTVPDRIKALRAEMDRLDLDGFVVPLTDEHASEYVAPYAQRLEWLTGFGGSAGMAIVMSGRAAIFVDGRYVLQVADQVDSDLFEHIHTGETKPLEWLAEAVTEGAAIGYDPYLHSPAWVDQTTAALKRNKARLVAVTPNPIDTVWSDQPRRPDQPAYPHDRSFAGKSSADKRAELAERLRAQGADVAVLTALDSIAWTFNIRGRDVAHTPVAMAFATLAADESAHLFIAPEKVTEELRAHLGNSVTLADYTDFIGHLGDIGNRGLRVLADPESASAAVFQALDDAGADIVRADDPACLPKATKNRTEIAGARDAHIRDGAALTEFLAWFDAEAPAGTLDELTAADRLLSLRKQRARFCETSFDTISGAGPNGAIIHYRVSPETNRRIEPGMVYLVDSGAQYLDGTTDVTRVLPVGAVDDEIRDRFTRVLKGHIALATTRFPAGTTGAQLDAIARHPLWQAGLDYDHGTGHGVGSFLAVHEGPQRIAKWGSDVALRPGMIISNEPGYYKSGAYGIRIENLVLVVAAEESGPDGRDMLEFETLTLAPIDRRLIDCSLLTGHEISWLDSYHARVAARLSDTIASPARDWLNRMTAPLAR